MTIAFLIVAWMLTLFGVHYHFIEGMDELFGIDHVTVSSYYLVFLAAGIVSDIGTVWAAVFNGTKKGEKEDDEG